MPSGAATAGAATPAAAHAPTVRLERTSVGTILVDGSGSLLYLFTRDRRNKDRCANVSGCLMVWPALTTAHRPVAGTNVRSSLLGTIKLRGAVRQVTYAGHPLYTYVLDFDPTSTFYVGTNEYGGRWYAVNAAGKAVK